MAFKLYVLIFSEIFFIALSRIAKVSDHKKISLFASKFKKSQTLKIKVFSPQKRKVENIAA
jgi:hypothetical protein